MSTTIAGNLNAVAGVFGRPQDERPQAWHEGSMTGERKLSLRPVLSRLYEGALGRLAQLGQAGSEAAHAALDLVRRMWTWLRNFLVRMARRMGGVFTAPRALSKEEARGEVEPAASIRQEEGGEARSNFVPVEVQKDALEQNASALADHVLLAGPNVFALRDRATAFDYVTGSLGQLQRVIDHNERQARELQAKSQELLLKIARREGTSPAVIERMIGSHSLLDKDGEYAALQQGIRSAKGSADTAREAMASLVASARSYDVPMDELDRAASSIVTEWDLVRSLAQKHVGAEGFGGEDAAELMLGERVLAAANDARGAPGGEGAAAGNLAPRLHVANESQAVSGRQNEGVRNGPAAADSENLVQNRAVTQSISSVSSAPGAVAVPSTQSDLPDVALSPFAAQPAESAFAQLAAKSRERRARDEDDWGLPPERPHDS